MVCGGAGKTGLVESMENCPATFAKLFVFNGMGVVPVFVNIVIRLVGEPIFTIPKFNIGFEAVIVGGVILFPLITIRFCSAHVGAWQCRMR